MTTSGERRLRRARSWYDDEWRGEPRPPSPWPRRTRSYTRVATRRDVLTIPRTAQTVLTRAAATIGGGGFLRACAVARTSRRDRRYIFYNTLIAIHSERTNSPRSFCYLYNVCIRALEINANCNIFITKNIDKLIKEKHIIIFNIYEYYECVTHLVCTYIHRWRNECGNSEE